MEPAAEPRPGPTGMPCSRAWRIRSQTIRKYEPKPILTMTSNSFSKRSRTGVVISP